MGLTTQKVSGLDIRPPKKKAFEYPTDANLPQLHQNMLIIGPRGSGKTCSLINLMERLPFDRVFMISPTMKSNAELMQRLNVEDADVYEDPDDVTCLDQIIAAVEEEAKELDQYLVLQKRYKKLMRIIHSTTPLFRLPDELLEDFYVDGEFVPPTHKWGGRKPCCALIMDDCLGSQLLTKGIRKLNKLCILHRHVGQMEMTGGALGISLFHLHQSYKCTIGGLSRPIRHQATSLIVFSLKDGKQVDEIASECSGEITPEEFMEVYKHAIQEKHDFLFIDLHPKPEHVSQFRRCFSEFIVPTRKSKISHPTVG